MKNEETAYVIRGADAVLVVEAGVPKRLKLLLLQRFGRFCDRWVVFVKGGIVLIKRGHLPWLVLVSRVGKYEAGDFSIFEPARRVERHVCRSTFCTPQRSLSFGWPAIGVKALMETSNLAEMLDDEVIVD